MAKKVFKPYTFTVPTLPKDTYGKFKDLSVSLDLSHWQLVCFCIELVQGSNPTWLKDRPEYSKFKGMQPPWVLKA